MRLLKLLLYATVVFMSIFTIHNVTQASFSFKDLSTTHPQYNEIIYLVNSGVINGVPVNGEIHFKAENAVTRSEVAKMVVIAAGYTPKKVSSSSFSDVPMDVMTGYIERAVELGFMSPTANGKFSPYAPIKRDEMSKVLALAFKLDVTSTQNLAIPFTDVSKTNSYYPYIAALYYNGITNGTGFNLYGISESVRRDSFATFVARTKEERFALPKPTLGVAAPDESSATARIYVNTDTLNVRTQPSNSGAIIGKVNSGDKLWGFAVEGNWVKVAFEGRTGYVSKSYIKFVDTAGMTFDLSKSEKKALASNAVVYRGTSSSTKVITSLQAGSQINIFGTKGEWAVTDVNGIPGYILASALVNSPSVQPTNPAVTVGRVTVDSLNIRQSASSSSAVVGKVKENDIVNVHSFDGWWAQISVNGISGYVHKTYLHLMNTKGSAVQNRIIVLDAGHGGSDPGATNGSVQEKDVVLDVTKRLRVLLEQAGAKVVLTRDRDTFISLNERPNIAVRHFGELFISIHTNSHGNTTALGAETYYNSNINTNLSEEMSLAKYINNEIVSNASMVNRGVKYGNFAVIRPIEMPAILIELGFLSNPSDYAKLTSNEYLQIFAQSIYNGIESFYSYK
jgi:N-acetylmuramoyl-L-alanine amidase